jgi:uncharacterized protein (TIGR00369 family)
MKSKVVHKQHNSKLCFICGVKNQFGLDARFYETEDKSLIAIFQPKEEHQSYPGRLHGGIASAILDETIGRAIRVLYDEEVWGVTLELKTKYLKPIPLNSPLKIVARITKDSSRFFEGTGELKLTTGEVAVTAEGKYLKLPIEKISDFNAEEAEWKILVENNDPIEIEF